MIRIKERVHCLQMEHLSFVIWWLRKPISILSQDLDRPANTHTHTSNVFSRTVRRIKPYSAFFLHLLLYFEIRMSSTQCNEFLWMTQKFSYEKVKKFEEVQKLFSCVENVLSLDHIADTSYLLRIILWKRNKCKRKINSVIKVHSLKNQNDFLLVTKTKSGFTYHILYLSLLLSRKVKILLWNHLFRNLLVPQWALHSSYV